MNDLKVERVFSLKSLRRAQGVFGPLQRSSILKAFQLFDRHFSRYFRIVLQPLTRLRPANHDHLYQHFSQ